MYYKTLLKLKCILLLFIVFFASNKDVLSQETNNTVFPEQVGFVNDFESVLTDSEEKRITKIIQSHEDETTNQIAIISITSIEPFENIFDYSLTLANTWGVGQKGKNNGILIVFSKSLRVIRIQNGFGIQDLLTDAETKKIIDELMIPEFKNGDYFQGLKKGIEAIIEEIK